MVNIYQKKYGNGSQLEPNLLSKTKEILNGAVDKGLSQSQYNPNDAFRDALRHNTNVFSAFRVHKMQSDIASQLLDKDGNLKPFGKFVKDVKPYVSHQNRAWLQTEYDTAVLRAHQAADWQRFEAEKDVLPNLEWMPSTSPDPGADHRPFWNTVLPIDHKFWKIHRPGDRWNCKCQLRNTDKPATQEPGGVIDKSTQPAPGLETNPGEKGEVFSNKHPYFPENCGQCPFNHGVGKLFAALVAKKGDCNKCKKVNEVCEEKNQHWKIPKIDFVPYSHIMIEKLRNIRDRRKKLLLIKSVIDGGELLYENKGCVLTYWSDNKGKDSANWKETFKMAKEVVNSGVNVAFTPEHDDISSADAITSFKGKYVFADFKHLTTSSWNTMQSKLEEGFGQAQTIVLKCPNINTGSFIETIEYMKRNNIRIGNIKLVNNDGKVIDISKKELENSKYKIKIKGFL